MAASVLQTVYGTDAAANGLTETVTLTVTAGSSIHVGATIDSLTTFASIASVPVMTWTLRDDVNDTGNNQRLAHWTADGAASGSLVITVTNTILTDFRGCWASEIGGTSGYDAAASAAHAAQFQATPGTGTDAVTSGNTSALSTQPACVSAFCLNSAANATPSVGTGFTGTGSGFAVGGGTNFATAEFKRVTATTAVASTFTTTSNSGHLTVVAVFKEAGATISAWFLPRIRPALPGSPFYQAWITRPRPINSASGPTQYLQSLAGTLNFAGGLVKQVGKITAGAVNFAGALTMRTLKNTAGAVNFSGGLLKQTNKLVAGSVNFAGGLIKRVSKLLGGAVSFTGTLATTKVILLSIAGSLNFSGGLTKQTNKLVAGSVNFAGACKKAVSHAVSGTVNFSGGLLKQVNKLTAGAVSFVGSLATLKIPGGTTFFQNVGGTLSFIGTLATSKIPFGAVVSDWIMRIRRRRR